MPLGDVFHEAHAFAFGGVRDDERRLARFGRVGQRFGECRVVVTVHGADGPAERAPFFVERFVAHHVARVAGDLERVMVENGHQVIQLVMRGGEARFPIRAFGQFAITQQCEHPEARCPIWMLDVGC